jgi:hypothetical protein
MTGDDQHRAAIERSSELYNTRHRHTRSREEAERLALKVESPMMRLHLHHYPLPGL